MDQVRTLRIFLALSIGLNMGLFGFVVGHFLLPEKPAPVPPPRPQPSPPATQERAADILRELDQDLSEEQWSSAVMRCGQLDAKARSAARDQCDRATRERSAKASLEAAQAAMVRHKHRDAIALLAGIPQSSVYRQRADRALADARRRYGTLVRHEIATRVRDGDCEGARQLAAEVKQLVAVDEESEARLRDCKTAVTVREEDLGNPSRRASRKGARAAKAPRAETSPGATFRDPAIAAQLLKQAQEAYVGGNHARAILSGHQALRSDPANKQAIQIIGASACYLKDARMARWAADRLSGGHRNNLATICQRAGISLE